MQHMDKAESLVQHTPSCNVLLSPSTLKFGGLEYNRVAGLEKKGCLVGIFVCDMDLGCTANLSRSQRLLPSAALEM